LFVQADAVVVAESRNSTVNDAAAVAVAPAERIFPMGIPQSVSFLVLVGLFLIT
jgi:hypothetical protein